MNVDEKKKQILKYCGLKESTLQNKIFPKSYTNMIKEFIIKINSKGEYLYV